MEEDSLEAPLYPLILHRFLASFLTCPSVWSPSRGLVLELQDVTGGIVRGSSIPAVCQYMSRHGAMPVSISAMETQETPGPAVITTTNGRRSALAPRTSGVDESFHPALGVSIIVTLSRHCVHPDQYATGAVSHA
jgi:hypothetical protein